MQRLEGNLKNFNYQLSFEKLKLEMPIDCSLDQSSEGFSQVKYPQPLCQINEKQEKKKKAPTKDQKIV